MGQPQPQLQDAPACAFRDPLPPTTYFGQWTTVGKCQKTGHQVTAEYCKLCKHLPDTYNGNLDAWLHDKKPNSDELGTSPRRDVAPTTEENQAEVK